MDGSGPACIEGFECAMVIKDEDSVGDDSDGADFPIRWAAPEVLREGILSAEAGIFSFAMVVIEVRRGSDAMC